MKFTLTIELGNEAMQTMSDIGRAVSTVASDIAYEWGEFTPSAPIKAYTIRDINGNTVGEWRVE